MDIRINSAGINDCAREWSWNSPIFCDYDLWAVFRGEGKLRSEGELSQEILVCEGAVLLLEPDCRYIGEHNKEKPLFVINIHFDILDEKGEPCKPYLLIEKQMTDIVFFRNLLLRTVTLFNSNRVHEAEHFLKAALTEFFSFESPNFKGKERRWASIIRKMTEEIDTARHSPQLSEFAERYGYTERYMGKMFTQINGIGFSQYVQNVRIMRAKDMLRNTDMTVAAIAEAADFYDACHFSRSFKQQVGISPNEYRLQKPYCCREL